MVTRVAGSAVTVLVHGAFGALLDIIESRHHDHLMPNPETGEPAFIWRGREGFIFEAWNDRDMTYGVLKDALAATYTYMLKNGWGEAFITIWDNDLQVGEGRILG